MTQTAKTPADQAPETAVSLLPFDPATLAQGIRVRPAQFARMCDVSRQTVSRWIAAGLVQLYPDGTLDPAVSARRLVDNATPARLRATLFKSASSCASELRRRCGDLEAKLADCEKRLADSRKQVEWLEAWCREHEFFVDMFPKALIRDIAALREAVDGDLKAYLAQLADKVWLEIGFSDAEEI